MLCKQFSLRICSHKKRSPESLWTAIKDHLPGDADDHFRTRTLRKCRAQPEHTAQYAFKINMGVKLYFSSI